MAAEIWGFLLKAVMALSSAAVCRIDESDSNRLHTACRHAALDYPRRWVPGLCSACAALGAVVAPARSALPAAAPLRRGGAPAVATGAARSALRTTLATGVETGQRRAPEGAATWNHVRARSARLCASRVVTQLGSTDSGRCAVPEFRTAACPFLGQWCPNFGQGVSVIVSLGSSSPCARKRA
jgi:hypothetical protein